MVTGCEMFLEMKVHEVAEVNVLVGQECCERLLLVTVLWLVFSSEQELLELLGGILKYMVNETHFYLN